MPEENKKTFLEELRSLDEGMKGKVLIVATIIIMALVLYFWFGYFNNLVSSVSQAPVAAGDQPQQNAQPNSRSVLAVIVGDFAGVGNWFINLFRGQRQYIVQPR